MSNNKYSPRTMPIITRESYSVEKPASESSWINEFKKNLEKNSVEPMRNHQDSIYDQISAIMGNKSKYPTVEAAVEDMRQRSGLAAHLKHSEEYSNSATKKANTEITLFKNNPQIKMTTDNYIEDTNGNLPVPAVIEKIKSIHKGDPTKDADWGEDSFIKYINDKNVEIRKMKPIDSNYTNLGKVNKFTNEDMDPSNSDALVGLNPNVVGK